MRLNMSRYAKKGYMASKKYFKHFFEVIYLYSVHPRFAKGVESPTKFSKKGTWHDLNFYRKVAGKDKVTFLSRGREGSQFLDEK